MKGKATFPPLRVCTQCEWIFHTVSPETLCPRCDSPTVSARARYGSAAYTYQRNQHPWKKLKVAAYRKVLEEKIQQWQQAPNPENYDEKIQ